MPNWCESEVRITHADADKLAALHKAAEAAMDAEDMTESFFNHVKPQPEGMYHGNLRVGGNRPEINWYDWNCENWGTKWSEHDLMADLHEGTIHKWGYGDEGTVVEQKCNMLSLYFCTAWSPPTPIIEELVSQGFHVEHIFMEAGWSYWGWTINGEEVASGEVHTHHVDAYGNSYSEWEELPDGAEGKGEKQTITKSRSDGSEYSYTIHEIEWEINEKKSKEKFLAANDHGEITELVWENCRLYEVRGG